MLPFLQDVLRADGLLQTIGGLVLADPLFSFEARALLLALRRSLTTPQLEAAKTRSAILLMKSPERLYPRDVIWRVNWLCEERRRESRPPSGFFFDVFVGGHRSARAWPDTRLRGALRGDGRRRRPARVRWNLRESHGSEVSVKSV